MDALRLRRPISELTSLHPESQNFKEQVSIISSDYYAWRDVIGDGNCLYRCIILALLEHFCRPFSDPEDLVRFYKLVRWQVSKPVLPGKEADDLVVMLTFERLMKMKESKDLRLMDKAERLLADEFFVHSLISLLRRISACTFLSEKPEPYYFEGIEVEMEQIKTMNYLSGQFDYIAQSLMLECEFMEVELGKTNYQVIRNNYFCARRKPENNRHLKLHFALIDGHHFMLYPRALETLERTVEGSYEILQEVTEESRKKYEEFAKS